MSARTLISDQIATFIESGLSINVATRDSDLEPDGAIAWAARVHEDREQITIYLHKEAAQAMVRNVNAHPGIAVLFERPTGHRACQVKGVFVSTRPAKPAERTAVEKQFESFFLDLEAIGIPRAMVSNLKIWPCTAIQFRATDVFEQSPGPGAGEPLR